ncbi:Twin-arginine translocation protein TatC [Minicystis rosea]|nr:Twin-arginine translocation protein TatC [Minicystis rosea]
MTQSALPENTEPEQDDEDGEGGTPMTFWEHLDELRIRLIRSVIALFLGCIVAWQFHGRLLEFLKKPYAAAWTRAGLPGDPSLHQAAPAAGFVAYIKLALIGGAALAAPVVFYQLWSFIAPGLYAREKKYIIPFVTLSSGLFVGGGWFAWRVAIPISMNYFLALSNEGGGGGGVAITPTFMVGEYIDFCLQVMLGFGLTFELPMLFLFLSIAGVVNYLMLIRYARWFIMIAFILAAILTPPDVISQLTMAIPMCILYGVSIGLVYIFGKPPTEAEKEAWRNRKKKPAES